MVALTHKRNDFALYAAAGLPRCGPIATRETTRAAHEMTVGRLVHALVAELAEAAQMAPKSVVADMVEEAVLNLAIVRSWGRADKLRLRVAGLVSAYFTHWLPPADATFVGAEMTVTAGRVDLAWAHPDVGIWFDEIKTWRNGSNPVDMPDTQDQLDRYLRAGTTAYDSQFAGVRLLLLGHQYGSMYVTQSGHEPLAGSRLDTTLWLNDDVHMEVAG